MSFSRMTRIAKQHTEHTGPAWQVADIGAGGLVDPLINQIGKFLSLSPQPERSIPCTCRFDCRTHNPP